MKITRKDLENPAKMLKLIDKGVYNTSRVERAYTDEIQLARSLGKPLVVKNLEEKYFDFVKLNNKYCDSYVEYS